MKINNSYTVFLFINLSIIFSCFYFPVTRDEFYYLGKSNINPFIEYYNSYHFVNPRIGQFFCNLISRNKILELIFGVLIFNFFIIVIFLNIYKKIPILQNKKDLSRVLLVSAFFIFLINYFGEMFYYTPFSTNYTLSHIFYLLFVFFFIEYYHFNRTEKLNRLHYLLIPVVGLFIGLSNEHVPPILLIMSFFGILFYFIKNKKFPNYKMILLPIFIFIGYCFLFFSPANKIKENTVKKSVFDIEFSDYIINFYNIIKINYYYNLELMIFGTIVFLIAILYRKKLSIKRIEVKEITIYSIFSLLPLFIVALSPLLGSRLLFFTNSILIIILYKISRIIFHNMKSVIYTLSSLFLVVYFTFSIIFTYNANNNYIKTMESIENQKNNKHVLLDQGFNYYTIDCNWINKKYFLESGRDYMRGDSNQENSVIKILKNYFHIKSLKIK